ncbi:hypothetical protein Tco_1250176 [Tanacetum coccineum]
MAQFWHTLKEDGSKHRFRFLLYRKELTLTLDDFRTIFHLPQANDNNHASFVPPPSFSDMVPFYKQVLGFTMELKTVSNFKIPGLLQPWQTLCQIFSKCLTTHVTGWDQPPLQIMQMLYCFGLCGVNVGRNKNKVGMRIPAWMITDEMSYRALIKTSAEVFGLDVPLTQSQRLSLLREGTGGGSPSAPMYVLLRHKSREEQEVRENVALVYEHLAAEEIKKLVEDPENVDDSSPPRHDDTSIPGTRLEPRSDKESPKMKFEKTQVPQIACRSSAVRTRDQDDPHDDAHPEGENSAKRQKTSEYEAYVSRESSSGQVNVEEPGPSTSGNQEQDDEFDFWTDSYASDDDEIPTKQITPLVQSCQRDPEAPALSLINQDLLYLKKGNSGPEKIVLSLHKFPAIVFNDDDIEERTSRWVNKRQKEPRRPKEEIYSNSKIVQIQELNKTDIEDNVSVIVILQGLKSYYNDVKYGYVQKELTNDEVEFLKLFEEEIEVRLNYRDQMRRWEM